MLKAAKPSPFRGAVVKCALAVALIWANPAKSQEPERCAPAPIARAIMEKQGAKVFVAMIAGNTPLEIWALPDGSEFRLFFVKDGLLCLIAAGTDLRVIAIPGQGV